MAEEKTMAMYPPAFKTAVAFPLTGRCSLIQVIAVGKMEAKLAPRRADVTQIAIRLWGKMARMRITVTLPETLSVRMADAGTFNKATMTANTLTNAKSPQNTAVIVAAVCASNFRLLSTVNVNKRLPYEISDPT